MIYAKQVDYYQRNKECKFQDIKELKYNVENVDNFVDNLKGGVKYGEFSKSSMYIRDRI